MSVKKETSLQLRLQKLIERRGGYAPAKSHGNMITVKGISDLRFTYKGLSVHWEVKNPESRTNVSEEQGIHCRLAKKAGGITAIISTIEQGEQILDLIDGYTSQIPTFHQWVLIFHADMRWDDGTSY